MVNPLLVSDNSLDSVPCTRELEYADALGKRVLPVRVGRGTSPKVAPPVLASEEWVDYVAGGQNVGPTAHARFGDLG